MIRPLINNTFVKFSIAAFRPCFLGALLMFGLSGCAGIESIAPSKHAISHNNKLISENTDEQKTEVDSSDDLASTEPQRVVYEHAGTDVFLREGIFGNGLNVTSEGNVEVDFRGAPLLDVVQVVLGEVLKVTYTIEGQINGTVTLSSTKPISEQALLGLLESLLAANGVVMVKNDAGIYRLGAATILRKDMPVRTDLTNLSAPGYTNRIIPLAYISVLEAHKILRALGAEQNILHVDPIRNLIMLAAPAPQMDIMVRTIAMFDLDVLEGMSFGIYEVFNVDATTIVERFNKLLGEESLSPIAGVVKLVPLEELNSVMVITPRSHYLPTVKTWIERLDELKVDGGEEGQAAIQLYVYDVQNGEAKDIETLLNKLFGKDSGFLDSPSLSGKTAPGRSTKKVGSKKVSGAATQAISRTRSSSSLVNIKAPQIVANESNNSLLILTEPRIWRVIRSTLKKIDVVPAQVLVEVSIWEVTLDNSLRYGVEWFFKNEFNGGDMGTATLDVGGAGIAATVPGFSFLANDFAGGWQAVINALDSQSKVEVLSSPSILVLDNETAEISVGNQQPIRTGSSVTDGGTVTENIKFKDTGVSLSVTPRVNAGGLVIMEISQDVTDVGNIDEATGQRAFLQRNIKTHVAVQSGDTIVLGGLIQQNKSEGATGFPFLSRIPILGGLFGSQSDITKRTELLITISPTAIIQYPDMKLISQEFQTRMHTLMATFDIWG